METPGHSVERRALRVLGHSVERRALRAPRLRWRGAIVIAVLALGAAVGLTGAVVELPRAAGRSVYDLAGVVKPEHLRAMETWHKRLFDQTQVAIVVVVVPTLEQEPIEDFAVRVGTEWGVGTAEKDRGIVMVLSIEERRVYIATGYGVEGFLPDGRVGQIRDKQMIPALRNNDFSGGLLRGSAALVAAAAEEYGVSIEGLEKALPRHGARQGRRRGGSIFGLLMLLLLIGMGMFGRGRGRGRGGFPLLLLLMMSGGMGRGGFRGGGFGGGYGAGGFGGGGFGGFGGGGFGGGGAGGSF